MSVMKYYFISKPIQYHTARQIRLSDDSVDAVLVICGNFYGSRDFYMRVTKYDSVWRKIIYFNSRLSAYLYIAFNSYKSNVYLDSDYGKDSILVSIISIASNKVELFEEGLFTYNDNLWNYYSKKNNKLVNIYRFFKMNNSLGSSRYVSGYYVYDLPRFKSCRPKIEAKGKGILKGFYPNAETMEVYKKVFDVQDLNIRKNTIVLYVGSKYRNQLISTLEIQKLADTDSFFLLFKPHPGSDYNMDFLSDFYSGVDFEFCESLIPAELLMPYLSSKRLKVLHHNSSIGMYLKASNMAVDVINIEE
ncbi:hypothetical protein [Vibrio chagasii]|uniref:hypothetical protein n=1 Tax=Vibrio chagasii TaxID=170679 RepID=UPI00163E021C|nr:hypothetical protein [Vibrio chagasii]